jgi:hypothetical protein
MIRGLTRWVSSVLWYLAKLSLALVLLLSLTYAALRVYTWYVEYRLIQIYLEQGEPAVHQEICKESCLYLRQNLV